ncbi:7799_t:CDS:2 [Ambispora leptoticha]|uniref:Mitochondrial distribution and morphology protein 34 n=1 Tax=Ambispora leptoticha TaxID=144679 RepID=A0A9N8Z8P6_9GLOM|nr:7799_t:CDS:2 [Ambispora leptoticha]
MAFHFNWPSFSPEFIEQSRQLLNSALNKRTEPGHTGEGENEEHRGGDIGAPELEILEIGELALDKFRGIFKLTYSGDAYLVLQTKVQANPMNNNKLETTSYTRRGILAADQPLVVPMLLRLSNLKLRGIVVLVVSKQKGITLVFKNDPLESVDVSSTFDSVISVQRFLQTEIEKRLRIMFQEDLPSIVHQLSLQKWLNNDKKNNGSCNINEKTLEKSNSPSRSSSTTTFSSFERSPFIEHRTSAFNDYFTESDALPYETMSMPELSGGGGYFSPSSTPSSELSANTSPDASFYAEDGYSMMGGDLESLDGFSAYSTYSNFGELFDKEKGLKAISQQDKSNQLLDSSRPRVLHRQGLAATAGKPPQERRECSQNATTTATARIRSTAIRNIGCCPTRNFNEFQSHNLTVHSHLTTSHLSILSTSNQQKTVK